MSLFLVYLVTFGMAGAYLLFNGPPSPSPFFALLAFFIMWVPGIIGLIFSKIEKVPFKLFQKPDKVCALALFTPIALSGGSLLFSLLFTSFKPEPHAGPLLLTALIGSMTVNTLAAYGEEIFWRGYLHEKWKHLGIVKASLCIGLVWGLWHAPLIWMGHNYPGRPIAGILMMTLLTLAMSPVFFWFREKGKSILVPALLHGALNGFWAMNRFFLKDPNPFLTGTTGITGIFLYALLSVWLIKRTKR